MFVVIYYKKMGEWNFSTEEEAKWAIAQDRKLFPENVYRLREKGGNADAPEKREVTRTDL